MNYVRKSVKSKNSTRIFLKSERKIRGPNEFKKQTMNRQTETKTNVYCNIRKTKYAVRQLRTQSMRHIYAHIELKDASKKEEKISINI